MVYLVSRVIIIGADNIINWRTWWLIHQYSLYLSLTILVALAFELKFPAKKLFTGMKQTHQDIMINYHHKEAKSPGVRGKQGQSASSISLQMILSLLFRVNHYVMKTIKCKFASKINSHGIRHSWYFSLKSVFRCGSIPSIKCQWKKCLDL